jgi:hypothetical protein
MAMLYDGIERMLADMQWSTKSTYQIQLTFYVISQPPNEDLLCQTVTRPDAAGPSIDMHRDGKSRFTIPGLSAECRGNERIDAGSNLRYLFEGKMNREVERPLIVQHRLPAVFDAVL